MLTLCATDQLNFGASAMLCYSADGGDEVQSKRRIQRVIFNTGSTDPGVITLLHNLVRSVVTFVIAESMEF